eukprot:13796006-Heterocapsa_arctica.AAC.1
MDYLLLQESTGIRSTSTPTPVIPRLHLVGGTQHASGSGLTVIGSGQPSLGSEGTVPSVSIQRPVDTGAGVWSLPTATTSLTFGPASTGVFGGIFVPRIGNKGPSDAGASSSGLPQPTLSSSGTPP